MPYRSNTELPESVRSHLPDGAQDLYRAAFNSAWQSPRLNSDLEATRGGRDATAHRVAWAAVKRRYEKVGENWVPKH